MLIYISLSLCFFVVFPVSCVSYSNQKKCSSIRKYIWHNSLKDTENWPNKFLAAVNRTCRLSLTCSIRVTEMVLGICECFFEGLQSIPCESYQFDKMLATTPRSQIIHPGLRWNLINWLSLVGCYALSVSCVIASPIGWSRLSRWKWVTQEDSKRVARPTPLQNCYLSSIKVSIKSDPNINRYWYLPLLFLTVSCKMFNPQHQKKKSEIRRKEQSSLPGIGNQQTDYVIVGLRWSSLRWSCKTRIGSTSTLGIWGKAITQVAPG